jgi:subtilisin family serine protease
MTRPGKRQGGARLHGRKAVTPPPRLEALEDRTLLSGGGPANVIDLSGLSLASTYSSSDILVQFRTDPATSAASTLLPAGTSLGQQLGLVSGLYEVPLSPGVSVEAALNAYRSDANVIDAEPDYDLGSSGIPAVSQFGSQWNFRNTGQAGGTPGADIHATTAWNVTTGSPSLVVAVNDTGIDYDHPDLYQNIWINQAEIPASRRANLHHINANGTLDTNPNDPVTFKDLNDPRNQGAFKITDVNGDGRIDAADILAPMVRDAQGHDTGKGGWAFPGNTLDGDTAHPNDFVGWNFVANDNDPFDDNGHGTHVAGIIGAAANSGPVVGVDWNVQLMALKFMDANGQGTDDMAADAIRYAADHGARVSNNSYGGPYSVALDNAVQYAATKNFGPGQGVGQVFTVAAGNNGVNIDQTPSYPASIAQPNVLSVAATDTDGSLAWFSNYGPRTVDVAAPGVNVYSTVPGGGYAYKSGTSMATPYAAGVAALLLAKDPSLSASQVIDRIVKTATPEPALAGKTLSGGILNAGAALAPSVALFSDSLSAAAPGPAWTFRGGTWAQSGGVLRQTSLAAADPRKAMITDRVYPSDAQITAEVRVDSWVNGAWARAGVGLRIDPATGRGYNLVFHGDTNTVQFLNDGVAWGNSYSFTWSVGTWYWFKLQDVNGVLRGKVWQDGQAEPAGWMFTQSGWTARTGGAPSLNGGSARSGGNATVSFSSVTVA